MYPRVKTHRSLPAVLSFHTSVTLERLQNETNTETPGVCCRRGLGENRARLARVPETFSHGIDVWS